MKFLTPHRVQRSLHLLVLLLIQPIMLFAAPAPIRQHIAANAGTYDIRDFGAVGDGLTDDTRAIQRAIDAASIKGGQVIVPVGKWLCKGHLELKMGVHLKGMNSAPQSWEPQSGSIILPTEGRDDENAPAFIEMRSSTSLQGVTIYYPEQRVDDIRPYPWTIQIRANPANPKEVSFDSTISDVTLINSYNGIRTGPTENGRHRIMGVHGCVLRRGIFIDWTGDIGRLENVQFSSHFWASKAFNGDWGKVYSYMQQHLEAFIFGRTDWEYVTNTFVFPAKIGYHFIATENGACNGQFLGIGADATEMAVLVEAIQPQGLLITNGEFDSHKIGVSAQIVVAPHCRGNVRFVNCGFWGPVEHNAILRGDGFVSFVSCYFSNDNPTNGASIEVESGKVQVQGCTFDAISGQRIPGHPFNEGDARVQSPAIHVGAKVESAILTENNGYYGVQVLNDAGDKTIIANNEPYHPPVK